jgi:hypothetical protein
MATLSRPGNPLQFFGTAPAAPACGANEHVVITPAVENKRGEVAFPSYAWDGTPIENGTIAWYTALSTSSSIPEPDWRVSRAESRMAWSYLLAADDIGTKVSRAALEAALPPPTVEDETSPNNFQWLWGLSEPASPAQLRAALRWLAERNLTDPACLGANRLIRVPGSCNDKPATLARNNGKPFHTRVTAWRPDRLYRLSELVTTAAPAGCRYPVRPFDPELADKDPVYRWLRARKLVLSKPNGDGWIDIKCPWADQHSDSADDLAGWRIGRPGRFNCFHSHGREHRTAQFMAWLSAQA